MNGTPLHQRRRIVRAPSAANRKRHGSAPYQANRKPLQNQSACWIPVAPGAPSDLSKSTEIWLTKICLISATYEIRTKMAKSRGLEKDGRRDRILGPRRGAAVQSFVREGPCLLGIFPRWQAGREYLPRCDWRTETNRNPTLSGLWINIDGLPAHPKGSPDVPFTRLDPRQAPVGEYAIASAGQRRVPRKRARVFAKLRVRETHQRGVIASLWHFVLSKAVVKTIRAYGVLPTLPSVSATTSIAEPVPPRRYRLRGQSLWRRLGRLAN